jgi:hypothetical protein
MDFADPIGHSVYGVGVQPLLVGIPGSNAAWGMDICLL